MAEDSSTNNDGGVFTYTGGGRDAVPRNVVRVRVHPSITRIPAETFYEQKKLQEVELCEGLLEIGERAFYGCHSLKKIVIPSSVKKIRGQAFSMVQSNIRLPDVIESIARYAFACNSNITNFRIPSQIVSTPDGMFSACKAMFSAEIPETVTRIEQSTFSQCHSLRNVAIPPSASVDPSSFLPFGRNDEGFFHHLFCGDLLQLFGEPSPLISTQIINALKHRFDNLPIHKMLYYQSYINVTSDELNNATEVRISRRRTKLNPSGSQQDCLGMTPLHIMACSTVQNISLYRVLIDKYPQTLVIEDRWGASPLLYAVWGRAPDEIVKFLVESYLSLYPKYEFNWTGMITTLGTVGAPVMIIQNLLDLQEGSFPDQAINWDGIIDKLAVEQNENIDGFDSKREPFQFLVKCSLMGRINAIGLKHYRDNVINKVMSPGFNMPYDVAEGTWLNDIRSKLRDIEYEYDKLKEATTLLELALWKMELNEGQNKTLGRQHKKMKIDRKQHRVSCGAEIVIQHVLPYLLLSSSELRSANEILDEYYH